MRLNEFEFSKLKQGKIVDHSNLDANQVIDKIKTHCSDFLNERGKSKRFLYRGMYGINHPIFISQSRNTRPAIDGPVSSKYKRLADFYMKNAGFTALRGNSTFCNSFISNAAGYGSLYFIFPVNGFTYSYSLKYTGTSAMSYKYPKINDLSPTIPTDLTKEELEDLSDSFVRNNQLKNTNLSVALTKEQDVWIRGKFIAVDFNLYHIAIYKAFGNKFMASDIIYRKNTASEKEQIMTVTLRPNLIGNITKPSSNVQMAAAKSMVSLRDYSAAIYITDTEAQKYILDHNAWAQLRVSDPDVIAYRNKLKQGQNFKMNPKKWNPGKN